MLKAVHVISIGAVMEAPGRVLPAETFGRKARMPEKEEQTGLERR